MASNSEPSTVDNATPAPVPKYCVDFSDAEKERRQNETRRVRATPGDVATGMAYKAGKADGRGRQAGRQQRIARWSSLLFSR